MKLVKYPHTHRVALESQADQLVSVNTKRERRRGREEGRASGWPPGPSAGRQLGHATEDTTGGVSRTTAPGTHGASSQGLASIQEQTSVSSAPHSRFALDKAIILV